MMHLLGPNTIQHRSKCFAYAVKSNNDTLKVKFRIHSSPCVWKSQCERQWCKYLQDPDNYRPVNLVPYGKYLSGMDPQKERTTLFSNLAKNARCLSNMGSTQCNENFIELSLPKTLRICSIESESTAFGVAAAVWS